MIGPRAFAALRRLRLALRSAAQRAYLRLAYNGIECHPSVRFGRGVRVRAFAGGTVSIGQGAFIQDDALLIAERGALIVGREVQVGHGSLIACHERIAIGDGTQIAEYVTIRDQDHRHGGEGRLAAQGFVSSPIEIGADVWLGAKVTVTRGVAIADRAVVGANSVVTRSLPQAGTYVGAPARPIAPVEPGRQSR